MYLEHFGFHESPFRITPHTEFFFTGAKRGATLKAMIYAITHDEGIVKVSGEVGSGKTMLCRMLLQRLPKTVDTVHLADPSLSRDEILHAIAEELGVPLPEGRTHLLSRELQDHLIKIYAQGRQVVIIVDEAHAMPAESLEEIRLLSNFEAKPHKLLHIVLFGQPELDNRLSDISMRQLRERITHNFALEPLYRNDVGSYLMFRIRAAGYRGADLFTPGAIQLIAHASEGLIRRINILADKALMSAFSEKKLQIDRKQVRAAIRDAQFQPMHDRRHLPRTWLVGGLVATGLALAIGGYSMSAKPPRPSSAPSPSTSLAQAEAPAPDAPPQRPAPTPPPATEAPQETSFLSSMTAMPSTAPSTAPSTVSLDEYLTNTESWLQKVPDSHYFIQLLSVDASTPAVVEQFLEKGASGLDPAEIRIYRSRLSGRDRYGIIYGDFPTRQAAQKELNRIVRTKADSGYYIRSVSKLR